MVLGGIKIAFLTTVVALVVDIGAIGGILSYAIGSALVVGAIALFNCGCRVAARTAAEQAEHKGATDALMRVRDRALADLATGDLVPSEERRQLQ